MNNIKKLTRPKFFILHSSFFILLAVSLSAYGQQRATNNTLLNRNRTLPAKATATNNKLPAGTTANTTANAAAAVVEEGSKSDLNFKDAPVDMVFEVYSKLVGRTVLKDPATPSVTITLESLPGQSLTKEEQIEAIEVALEMNGIHFEEYGEKFVRALPRKDVRKEGIPLIMDIENNKLDDSGKVVSVMINFKNISAQDEAQKALEGFKSNSGLLQVFERTNSILVTDTQQNINRMMEIAKAIDISTPVLENVYVRQIKNASATEIKAALQEIVQESQKELEKTGKAQQNAAASEASRNRGTAPRTLLARPGQKNPEPAAPTSVESLVTSVSEADRGLIRGKVLILADERSNKLVIITSKANMDFFDKIIEQLDIETTPDTVVKVYRLKYADAEDVSDMINDLIGNSAGAKSSSKQNQNANAKSGGSANVTQNRTTATKNAANQRTGEAKAGELTKDNTTVLADKRINGLVVMTQKELVGTLEKIIESMDIKLSQVLIETCIIEISLGDNLKTGIDWVMGGKVAESAFMNHGQMIGGGGGTTAIGSFVGATTNIVNPVGKGLNYFVKSDKLNLASVIEASKTDSRSKYVASPIVMTVDNKEATIEATASRQFLTGWSAVSGTNGAGMPSPNYTAKDIGITLKITPKINPNGTVMLEVEEEYSQVSGKQSMLTPKGTTYETQDIDVSVTRKMAADISLENGESVVLGGLTTKTVMESESGIPILKDIPWIGKWLFGTVEQDEQRSELLVFMTPYVLDDAESAKLEAMRRKKTMSDPNPWDDDGWSKSTIADPVSQKEQMRRLKDEAKKQDEERKSRLAIEQWKIDRAKALEKMDEEDRALWIKRNEKELKKEAEEYEQEQAELKELVETVKEGREEKNEELRIKNEELRSEESGVVEHEVVVGGQGSVSNKKSLLGDLQGEEAK